MLHVLILVLVDVGLGQDAKEGVLSEQDCLNPCFSGCWSRTATPPPGFSLMRRVLILVLVDVGLGHSKLEWKPWIGCLNPCFSGCWSRTLAASQSKGEGGCRS